MLSFASVLDIALFCSYTLSIIVIRNNSAGWLAVGQSCFAVVVILAEICSVQGSEVWVPGTGPWIALPDEISQYFAVIITKTEVIIYICKKPTIDKEGQTLSFK